VVEKSRTRSPWKLPVAFLSSLAAIVIVELPLACLRFDLVFLGLGVTLDGAAPPEKYSSGTALGGQLAAAKEMPSSTPR
jgi:hypothetical protein